MLWLDVIFSILLKWYNNGSYRKFQSMYHHSSDGIVKCLIWERGGYQLWFLDWLVVINIAIIQLKQRCYSVDSGRRYDSIHHVGL